MVLCLFIVILFQVAGNCPVRRLQTAADITINTKANIKTNISGIYLYYYSFNYY